MSRYIISDAIGSSNALPLQHLTKSRSNPFGKKDHRSGSKETLAMNDLANGMNNWLLRAFSTRQGCILLLPLLPRLWPAKFEKLSTTTSDGSTSFEQQILKVTVSKGKSWTFQFKVGTEWQFECLYFASLYPVSSSCQKKSQKPCKFFISALWLCDREACPDKSCTARLIHSINLQRNTNECHLICPS